MALDESPVTVEQIIKTKVGLSGVFGDEKPTTLKVTHKKQMAFNEEMIRLSVEFNNQDVSVDLKEMQVHFFMGFKITDANHMRLWDTNVSACVKKK